MIIRFLVLAAAVAIPAQAQAAAPKTVEVMILGTFHMSNPGKDLHNMQVDDVLAPARQSQIEGVASALARFRPTRVMVEWPATTVAERYPQYVAGTLPPSRNEVVQLGFRLARKAGAPVSGIDADGDFPFDAVKSYADAHGMAGMLAAADAQTEAMNRTLEDRLSKQGVSERSGSSTIPPASRTTTPGTVSRDRSAAGRISPGPTC